MITSAVGRLFIYTKLCLVNFIQIFKIHISIYIPSDNVEMK